MEYKEVKELVDDSLKPLMQQIGEVKNTVKPIPALVERLTSYKEIEKKVNDHDFILCGTRDKPGMIKDIKQLKTKNKALFNFIIKIAAFTGTILGLLATGKAFFF